MKIAAFFAGIAGIELGFHSHGDNSAFFCEKDNRAQTVLRKHFSNVPIGGDIQDITVIPDVDIITAGFPCQDLSQAGLKRGIEGNQSGLVQHLFRIINDIKAHNRPEWIVIENVSYMISLDSGNAIKYLTAELEKLGYMWGYRVVDARAFGVPQRRLRLLLVASRTADVREVLFSENIPEPPVDDTIGPINEEIYYGFYWTEGKRGLGWTVDGVPTLKIGSKIGIPSPPAIWDPKNDFFGTPDIRDAERLQGFEVDWTQPTMELPKARPGDRWHLVGNAVCVPMSEWLAERIHTPLKYNSGNDKEFRRKKWPKAAYGYNGRTFEVVVSTWPIDQRKDHLNSFLKYPLKPLSRKAMQGFYSRAISSELINYPELFIRSMEKYQKQI